MRPRIHPIIDIEDVPPSAFLVLSELATLRHEIENRQSESPVETYDTLLVVRTVWGLNFEEVALHVTLILRHWFPSLKSLSADILQRDRHVRFTPMCGRIWTPPDCNSSTGSGSRVTTADVYPAS